MAFDFTGKKVLVTGAGRGIGRGIALALARSGCKVFALDCVEETLDTLIAENSNITKVFQDLSNWTGTKATLEQLCVLDGLVNNAAIHLGLVPAMEEKEEDLEKYMKVNVYAAINCIQVIASKMIEDGRKGSIVNVSSQASLRACLHALGYSVSKAALDMVTKQFALELGPHNIRVNSINQTAVDTEMAAALDKQMDVAGTRIERTPLGRIATVDEIVGPVMYLLSDYAAMVTGTTHLVDGGIDCNITTKK